MVETKKKNFLAGLSLLFASHLCNFRWGPCGCPRGCSCRGSCRRACRCLSWGPSRSPCGCLCRSACWSPCWCFCRRSCRSLRWSSCCSLSGCLSWSACGCSCLNSYRRKSLHGCLELRKDFRLLLRLHLFSFFIFHVLSPPSTHVN
jgi:hypothetical protein